jgi:acetyltransferase
VRIVVHGPEVRAEQFPKPAIRPYPNGYVASWTMKDGATV